MFKFNKLIRASFIMTAAGVIAGLMGYAYQIVMGRLLSSEDFAMFGTIMALMMLIGSPLNAMFLLISRRVAELCSDGVKYYYIRNLYYLSCGLVVLFGIILLSFIFLFSENIITSLMSININNTMLFAGSVIFSALYVVNNAFFQGMTRFYDFAITSIFSVALKMFFGTIFIALGYGISGVLVGLIVSYAVVWIYGSLRLKRFFPKCTGESSISLSRFPVKTVLPVLIANIAFGVMTQLDMVLVKILFLHTDAATYAAASILGKAILYLPSGLVLALFPMVVDNHASNKSSTHMLKQAVFLTLILCGTIAIIYWFMGHLIMEFFFGPAYTAAAELLRWYGLAVIPMALVMIAEYFLIAQGRVLFVWLFLLMCPIQIFAIISWHDELWNVIAIMSGCGIILVIIGYGLLWLEYKKNRLTSSNVNDFKHSHV